MEGQLEEEEGKDPDYCVFNTIFEKRQLEAKLDSDFDC